MSDSNPFPPASPDAWSARISDRYQCVLPPVLLDWFDSEIWKQSGRGEYREAVDPACLMQQAPEMIWPGLMSCDLLPILGNTVGDWLCVRVDRDNRATEIVQWYHGGGDWIPWGNSLAEAIVFDALVDRLPGKSRRHAIPAENPRPQSTSPATVADAILQWARQHVPPAVSELFDGSADEQEVARTLLDHGIAEIAVRCELVLADLMQKVAETLVPVLREDLSIHRNQLAEWSFDVDRLPEDRRQQIERRGVSFDAIQDWQSAADHARRVTELAPDLAWAWDVVGYAAERSDDLNTAKSCYREAAGCSVFTDQSIRLETYWTSPLSAKFGVARLRELCPGEIDESIYFQLLCEADAKHRRIEITKYWMDEGSRRLAEGQQAEAHQCFMAAAWDVGAQSIPIYGELLDKIAHCAAASGQPSRAETARTHRRCLADRYGV